MYYHISITFSTIFAFFLFLFHLLFLICFPQHTFYNLAAMFNSVSLQPTFNCSFSTQNTIQKIFTKRKTTFQNKERNDDKIAIMVLKKHFYLSCYHIQVCYWQVLAVRQLRSLVFSRTIFGVELSFFLKVQRLHFGQFRLSLTQIGQGYFEIVWLLPLYLQVW